MFGATPLIIASQNGYEDIVHLLLSHKADPNLLLIRYDAGPLFVACERGHTEVAKMLLNDERTNLDVKNIQGLTPIHVACQFAHFEIVKMFIRKGVSIGVGNKKDMQLLKEKEVEPFCGRMYAQKQAEHAAKQGTGKKKKGKKKKKKQKNEL